MREQGMKGLGINAVGKKAGVSTELIYRYFDGIQGLLLTWMKQQDFWTQRLGEFMAPDTAGRLPADLLRELLHEQIDLLHRNSVLKEIRLWELVEQSEVGRSLATRREKAARVFIDRIDDLAPEDDVPALLALLMGGLLYLTLRARTETHYFGVPLREPEGWDRLWRALDRQLSVLPEEFRRETLGTLERKPSSAEHSAGMNEQKNTSNPEKEQ